MKILFINISDIKGGAAKAIWRIANQLEKDYKIENLFLVRDKFSNQDNVIPTRSNKFIYKLEWAINVFFNLIGLQYKFLPFSSRKILKTAREFKPDIISLNQIEGGYFQTRDMIKLSRIAPIVWTMHDLWAINNNSHRIVKEYEKEKNIYPAIGIRWGNWLKRQKRKIYNQVQFATICPSHFLFDQIRKNHFWYWYPTNVIPHGIDLDKFTPNFRKDKENRVPRILFVAEKISKGGNLLKRILEILDIMIDFRVIVYLVGSGDIISKYAFDNLLIVHKDYIWEEDSLVDYYQDADIFLYPSQADIFGLVLIEAMACGLPIIATDVDAIPEVLNGTGITFDPDEDADNIAFVLKKLLEDKKETKDLGDLSWKSVGRYDIKNVAKQYYEVFKCYQR